MMRRRFDAAMAVPSAEQLRRRSARGAVFTTGAQLVRLLVTIASAATLARLLGPDAYGIVGMSATAVGFVSLFRDLGLSAATIQRQALTVIHVSTLFWVNLLTSAALAAVTIAGAPLVAAFYHEPRLTGVVAASAIAFPLGGLGVQHQALLCREMRFGTVAALELIAAVIGFVASLAMGLRGYGYWSLIGGTLVSTTVQTAGAWLCYPWRPGRGAWDSDTRAMMAFGGHLTGFNIVNYFARNADNVLIGWSAGVRPLGYYDRAYELLLLPLRQINGPLSSVMVPLLSRLAPTPAIYTRTYLRIVEKMALLTMPAVTIAAITADWVVLIVLGPSWAPAARLYALLALTAPFQTIGNTTGWLLISQGRGNEMFRLGVLSSVVTVAGFAAGLHWGPEGVAASYVVTTLGLWPYQLHVVTRRGPLSAREIYSMLRLPIASSVAAALAVWLLRATWQPSPLVGMAAAVIVGGAAALAAVISTGLGRAVVRDLLPLAQAAGFSFTFAAADKPLADSSL